MPSSSPKKINTDTDSKTNTPPRRLIVLKLSSTLLSRFPSDSPAVDDKDVKVKDASSPPSSTSGEAGLPPSSLDNASDAASTPAATAAGAVSEGDKDKSKGNNKKGTAATARGTKRALNQNGEPGAKAPRSRPSAKKRLKIDDKTLDTSRLLPPSHKLGPKANQGAINAGLRALDRSGAPCRKWERKSFQLKSFTGVVWGLSSWHTPKPQQSVDSSSEDATNGVASAVNGDSDSKANPMSSAVPSEKSNAGDTSLPPSTAQSPTPLISMTA